MIEPLTASADVMTGAMIALIPSPDDAKRLAVDGGEALDQLHLTLLYLGDADQIDESTRDQLRDWAREAVAGWDSVEANAFAPALFNPTGDEPCAVLICSGPDLAEFYETTLADVSELVELPDDLHAPWVPHISVVYSDVYATGDEGVGDAGTGSADRRSSDTRQRSVSDLDSYAVQSATTGMDSARSSSQRDSSGGGSRGGSSSGAERGHSPHVWDSQVRGAVASANRNGVGPSEASRLEADSRDLLKAPGIVQGAQHTRMGSLRELSAREYAAIPAAPSGKGEGLLSHREGSGFAASSRSQVQPEAGDQGTKRGKAARAPSAIEAIELLTARTGPVNFDRLRLAFAGEVLDVPFGAKTQAPAIPAPDAAADETQDELTSAGLESGPSVVASAVPTRDEFDGCLRCWGQAHTGACPPAL